MREAISLVVINSMTVKRVHVRQKENSLLLANMKNIQRTIEGKPIEDPEPRKIRRHIMI